MPIYDVTLSGKDAFNGRFNKRFKISAVDYPTALSDTADMISDFEAVVEAGVQKYSVSTTTFENETPAAGSNVDEGLTFSLDLGDDKSAALKIPAPSKVAVNSDRSVDLTDGDISNLLDNWINGPFLISDGETAIGVIKGTLDD